MIGARIRMIREEAGLKQMDFAKQFDVKQALLSLIENGHVQPSIEFISAIVKAYGVSYEWLIEGKIGKANASTPDMKLYTDFVKNLVGNLRSIMKDEQLGEALFAKRCLLTQNRLADILNGEVIPGGEELLNILNAFPQYNANWLIKNVGGRKIIAGNQLIEELLREKDEIVALMQSALPPKGKRATGNS